MNILKTEDMVESPWITPKRLIYENDEGQVLKWDYIERSSKRRYHRRRTLVYAHGNEVPVRIRTFHGTFHKEVGRL